MKVFLFHRPSPDFSFEKTAAVNFSSNLYIFSVIEEYTTLLAALSNRTRLYALNIAPNDPADFARNSFDSQTLNSVFSMLKNQECDILKIDKHAEHVKNYEVLKFMIEDNLLQKMKVKELHIVIELGKYLNSYTILILILMLLTYQCATKYFRVRMY